MQMASSYQDCRDANLSGLFDFTMPDFMPTWLGGPASPSPATGASPGVTSADAAPSFWSQIPGVLTAGLQAFTTTSMLSNPNVAAALLRPSGVTGSNNPYGIPSGGILPPGVTAMPAAYPPGYFNPPQSMLPLIVIGAGGILLIALMSRRR